jgi:hypothetical protein
MSFEPRDYLRHILVEADYLVARTGLRFEEFVANETLQRAFARSLEINGEAAKKVPEEFRAVPDGRVAGPGWYADRFVTTSAWTMSSSGTSFKTASRGSGLISYRYSRHNEGMEQTNAARTEMGGPFAAQPAVRHSPHAGASRSR